MTAPTYYRHRNDDFKHELVVRAYVPDEGDLWRFTATDSEGAFEPQVTVHVRTDHFEVYARFPEFFTALAEQKPSTVDEVAGLLDRLGVVDDTAVFERRRAETNAACFPYDDSWPYL